MYDIEIKKKSNDFFMRKKKMPVGPEFQAVVPVPSLGSRAGHLALLRLSFPIYEVKIL